MADSNPTKSETAAPVAPATSAEQTTVAEAAVAAAPTGSETEPASATAAADASMEEAGQSSKSDEAEDATKTEAEPADKRDSEMKEAVGDAAPDATADAAPGAAAVETPNSKNKNRRKSTGGGLSKKGSRARLTHHDAKPGDYFLVKLKGFPPWPVIICDESMLPPALIDTRPVSAAKADGSYADAYADGGKRVNERSFPILYLYTNEFGWAANTTLNELSKEKARESINSGRMRQDLRWAMELAVEQHPIEYYKEELARFEEEQISQQKALEEEKAAKKEAAATPKKSKKARKSGGDDDDVDMEDMDASASKPKSNKKRKAEDEANKQQRSDSVKKPKIKLNTSSKSKANGTPSKKSESSNKTKSDKKTADGKKAKEPKMTPEEKRERKQKEVFYLRHKLQKGLLSKDQPPVESEMKGMSEYLTHLETFTDLEASIIRETKINKVLKAILKMESIPHEEEYNFKKRSQGLLDKWNKLLANAAAAAPAGNTNGVNGAGEKKDTNGTGQAGEAKAGEAKAGSEKPSSEANEKTEETGEPAKVEDEASKVEAEAATE